MTDPFEFELILPRDPSVQASARYSADMEVSPTIDRPAPQVWRYLFHQACDAAPGIEWFGAGFARCAKDELIESSSD